MRILKIKKCKNCVKITLDSEKLDLLPSVYASYNLYINKIIEEKELSEIKSENKIEENFICAVKRLSQSFCSPKKISEFLQTKGANKLEISKVLEKLRKYQYLNEGTLVKEIISFCDSKHYGYHRIIKMLIDRKISQEEILKIEYNSKREEKEGILQLKILEKRHQNKNNFNRKKAVYSGLIRCGFDEQISLELVNKIANSNHMHEINVLKLDYDKCFSKYSRKYVGYELNQKITTCLLCKGYRINDINYVKEIKK